MENLSLILIVFCVEFLVDFIVARALKIKCKTIYILFLQVPKLCALALCLYFEWSVWLKMLARFLARVITIFFLTDSFGLKKLAKIFGLEYLFLFSVTGFVWFIISWIEGMFESYFLLNFPTNRHFLIVFGIFLYIFALFTLARTLSKNKNLCQHLLQVSLYFKDKHINVYGLVDSGNSLVDPRARKPVLVISQKSILKLISKNEYQKLLSDGYSVKCETIAHEEFSVPIIKDVLVKIKIENEILPVECVVGVIDKKFENGKYDCLLWRDFL